MRKRVATFCLLCAWLCANGALLDAVQVFAWGKMFAGYSQTMPLTSALRETLDPSKPCELCVAVAGAREDLGQKEMPPSLERSTEKVVLALHVPGQFFLGRIPAEWPAALARTAARRVEPVPVPPPRA